MKTTTQEPVKAFKLLGKTIAYLSEHDNRDSETVHGLKRAQIALLREYSHLEEELCKETPKMAEYIKYLRAIY